MNNNTQNVIRANKKRKTKMHKNHKKIVENIENSFSNAGAVVENYDFKKLVTQEKQTDEEGKHF